MRKLWLTAFCLSCGGTAPMDPTDGTTTGDSTSTTTASTSSATEPTTTGEPTGTTEPATTGEPTTGTSTASTTDSGTSGTTGTTGGPGPVCDPDALAGLPVVDLDPPRFADGDDPSGDPSCTDVHNPGRGFYQTMDLLDVSPGELADIFDSGRRLAYGRVRIPDYIDKPLDDALLDAIELGFSRARDAGLTVIPRVYYAADQSGSDAPLDVVLGHIDQLAPVWQAHADVIAVVQAGFIGAWGEWHGSMNDLDNPDARNQILDALLLAVPPERMIQVRRPSFKEDAVGGPLDAATVHDQSSLARLAHHNDCFLASDSDQGTYGDAAERAYMEADAPFTMNGGETCATNPPRSECTSALAELELLHYTYLNEEYHPGVLQSWKDDGCFRQIECRLGYRLLVTRVRAPAEAAPGATIGVEVSIFNDGWASLHNPRPLALVLHGPSDIRVDLDIDPRTFMPGEETSFCVAVDLPADAPAGSYDVALHLPDASPGLAARSEYAVRIANAAWDDATALNMLPVAITVP